MSTNEERILAIKYFTYLRCIFWVGITWIAEKSSFSSNRKWSTLWLRPCRKTKKIIIINKALLVVVWKWPLNFKVVQYSKTHRLTTIRITAFSHGRKWKSAARVVFHWSPPSHRCVCVGLALFLAADGRIGYLFCLFWRERIDVPLLTSGTRLRDDVTHTVTMATAERGHGASLFSSPPTSSFSLSLSQRVAMQTITALHPGRGVKSCQG